MHRPRTKTIALSATEGARRGPCGVKRMHARRKRLRKDEEQQNGARRGAVQSEAYARAEEATEELTERL
jgi:hypothetical protein